MTSREAQMILSKLILEDKVEGDDAKAVLIGMRALSWIPCSERLPGWDTEVLVTTAAWRVHIATKCWGDGWLTDDSSFYDDDDIIAWMPLPVPYKGEEDNG